VTIQNCLILSKVHVGDKAKIKDAKIPMSQVIEEKANITGETGE
jgi:ADP-glucose pyrophosphorylase